MAEEAVAGSSEGAVASQGSAQAGGGSSTTSLPDWGTLRASLGELGKDKSLDTYKDIQGFFKSSIEAQKMIGRSIQLPSKDLKPEDRSKAVKDILGKLRKEGVLEGVPESPDKYDIKLPQMEGWTANEPLVKGFKEIAHKTGVTPTQAQNLFDWYLNFQESAEAQSKAEFEEMKANMKKEMGGLYTRRMEAARRAVAKYIGADGDEVISSLPPQIGKKLVMAFAEIGDPLLEDALIQGEKLGVSSLSDTEKKINEIVANKSHPLWDVSNPGHKQAVEEWTALQRVYVELKGRK